MLAESWVKDRPPFEVVLEHEFSEFSALNIDALSEYYKAVSGTYLGKCFNAKMSPIHREFDEIEGLLAAMGVPEDDPLKRIIDQGLLNDISAVSAYAPYMDAMFLDKTCAALLLEEPLATELNYKARIFLLKNKEAFLAYLTEIEDNTSDEVRGLAARIYGMA